MVRQAGTAAMALVLAAVAGCGLPSASPLPASPSSSAAPSSPDVPSSPPPTDAPGETAGGEGAVDPATFLQLCGLPPDDAREIAIECFDLVTAAIEGLPAGTAATRIETSYTCATSCRPFDPDRGYAIVTTEAGVLELEVARQADGTLAVESSLPIDPPDPPAFEPPPASAPAADGAPPAVNGREPLPLCGVETGTAYDPFDVAGRQCFWDGMVAGSAVEFVTVHPDTEGLLTTTIYRYPGTGGVELFHNDEGGWWRTYSGVRPAREEGRIFDLDGLTDRQRIP